MLHPPQWLVLLVVFTHAAPHAVSPAEQAAPHCPAEQKSPAPHALSQEPQLAGSLWSSTQPEEHAVWPVAHVVESPSPSPSPLGSSRLPLLQAAIAKIEAARTIAER